MMMTSFIALVEVCLLILTENERKIALPYYTFYPFICSINLYNLFFCSQLALSLVLQDMQVQL